MREIKQLTKEQIRRTNQIHKQLIKGAKQGKVYTYVPALIDRLRPYQVGGLPVSILLLITELCNGLCYDRSLLMSLAFNDAKIVHGDIESLRITAGEKYAEHSFVETTEFGGNKTWVVDTSIGLIYDKDFYYELEKVKVNAEIPKQEIMNSYAIQSIISSDFEQDKYALPLYLPLIENVIKTSRWLGTASYREMIEKEIAHFKEAIDYESIEREIAEDMKLMKTDPNKLDEKFQIVRDRYGREISRGGVPNPYYISPEEADKKEQQYKEAEANGTLDSFWQQCYSSSADLMEQEAKKVEELAEIRFAEIAQNPTRNFYETQPGQN